MSTAVTIISLDYKMTAMLEPSLLSSTTRPPFSANAPSMADTLPSISFGFEDLRDRMAHFTDRFDVFIAKGRKRVLEERNQFRITVAELHEEQRLRKRDTEILSQKSTAHALSVQKEVAESSEMHTAIDAIAQQRDARAAHRDRLLSEIASTKKQIAHHLALQQQHAKTVDAQACLNEPELEFWMDYLCLRIEGVGHIDRLRFVFSHLDDKDWEHEAWFELDTEKRDYRVVSLKPKLEGDEVDRCVERLNETRQLGGFLKRMRELFVAALK